MKTSRIARPSSPQRWLVASTVIAALSLSACGATDDRTGAKTAAGAATASAATGNWTFEAGDLSRWDTRAIGSGAWRVYSDGATPPDPTDSDRDFPFNVPDPPEGKFAAVTDMSAPGARILQRDVHLDGRFELRFTLFYVNPTRLPRQSATPPSPFHLGESTQQFRVDLIDPTARLNSVSAKDVLATLFATAPGDARKLAPRVMTFDLSRWAGRKVRIRFAQVDNSGPLRAGVDDVRLNRR